MTDPVCVSVELKDLENLVRFAQECAEDLEVEVAKNITGNDPISLRHKSRATTASRWLLSAIPALRIKYTLGQF